MTQMQRYFIIGFIVLFGSLTTIGSDAAVTSTGEINVKDEDFGRVPASTTVTLIVTLIIDRSLAEPGEEIKTIEILLPSGFSVEPTNFRSFSRDGEELTPRPKPETVGNSLRIVLDEAITDFRNTVNEIIFDSRTPNTTANQVTFRVRLRNLRDQPLGPFIKPGNADGKSNNNDFTLQVLPNIPPEAVKGFSAESDPTGENDVTIRWRRSEDPDVSGHLIYRDSDTLIEVKVEQNSRRETEIFPDVNVPPGRHTYAIEAYKGTKLLKSDRSQAISVLVSEDTARPEPPERLTVVGSSDGVGLTWNNSPSRDVTAFQIFFGTSPGQLNPLPNGEILVDSDKAEYEFTDPRTLRVGVFIYAVEAIDEAGNRSRQTTQTLRILGEPFPNPFTPLSDNTNFNRVVFPARAIENAEGEFIVLIFDTNGALIKELKAAPGDRELKWDGKDNNGDFVESGVYVYQMQVGEDFKVGTVIVAK